MCDISQTAQTLGTVHAACLQRPWSTVAKEKIDELAEEEHNCSLLGIRRDEEELAFGRMSISQTIRRTAEDTKND